MRKFIAILLLLAAAAGLVYGVLGATTKAVSIKSGDAVGVFNLSEGTYEGTLGFSSAGGFSMGMDDLRKLAQSQRNKQMWLGFGGGALLGIIGISLLRKKRY